MDVATQLFDKVFSQMPVGTPDQVLSTIQDICELVHPSHIAAAMKFGGMPMEFAEKSLRLFAKEVLPAIQEMPVLEPIVREPARRSRKKPPNGGKSGDVSSTLVEGHPASRPRRLEVQIRTTLMFFTTVTGLRMYYEVHGEDGSPVFVIHGFQGGHLLMGGFVRMLQARNRVLLFDQRGTGQSDKPDEPYTVELIADETVELMKHAGFSPAHVVGCSMGGMIAQEEVVLRHPDQVLSLVLGCTTSDVRRLSERDALASADIVRRPPRPRRTASIRPPSARRLWPACSLRAASSNLTLRSYWSWCDSVKRYLSTRLV